MSGGNMGSHVEKLLQSWSSAGRTWDENPDKPQTITALAGEEPHSPCTEVKRGEFSVCAGWRRLRRNNIDLFIMIVFRIHFFTPLLFFGQQERVGRTAALPPPPTFFFYVCPLAGSKAGRKKGMLVLLRLHLGCRGIGSASRRVHAAFSHINWAARMSTDRSSSRCSKSSKNFTNKFFFCSSSLFFLDFFFFIRF